jgi:4-amino-4-deoxy-L-arabinose transferase-like glycosyltransferase
MNNRPAPLDGIGRFARAVFWAGFVYWAIYALLAPVTTIDSQMYNLARLELAARGGFFDSDYFTSVFHVIFPWAYDAVHFPFLRLGWGCALPGFLCLSGTLFVVFRLMRERCGPDAAWVAAASLLALPCLVYQGSSTKNDIPILFCGAVWAYARWRRQREGKEVHLVWMVLAIGFMAGAKTTGVLYGFVLALITLWEIRASRRLVLQVTGGLVAALVLFGSVETYVESARIYGDPLGPPPLRHRLSNRDGVRGALANQVRHLAAGVYVGPTDFSEGQASAWAVSGAARKFLNTIGLTDAGIEPRYPDRLLFFSQSGMEELSGFGPVGMFGCLSMLAALFYWRPQSRWWQLSMIGFVGIGIVSATLAYHPWMNRYLIAWYTLATLGFVCALWETDGVWVRRAQWAFGGIIAAWVVATPLLSFNRGPAAIVAAIRDRERLETSADPVIGRLRERLRAWRTQAPAARVFLVATDESVILPVLTDDKIAAIVVTPAILRQLAQAGRLAKGDVVATEGGAPAPGLAEIEAVSAPNVFSENGTSTLHIYRVE